MGLPTQPSIPLGWKKVMPVFTLTTEVDTIKTADWGYFRLHDYRPKSVTEGLSNGLSCTPALSVTITPLRMRIQHYMNEQMKQAYNTGRSPTQC